MVCRGCHDFPRVPGSITDELISPLEDFMNIAGEWTQFPHWDSACYPVARISAAPKIER